MTVERQPSAADWEGFLKGQPAAPFLQSWGWGEFQTAVGRPAHRFLVFADGGQLPATSHQPPADGRKPVAGIQALVHRYPLGFTSLYVPQGPVVQPGRASDVALATTLADELRSLAREVGAVFVRIEPAQAQAVTAQLPVRSVPGIQPSVTSVLDLRQSEDELLAAMHQKTRYNLRVAERSGVHVTRGGVEHLETFLALLQETESRERVHFFGARYFRAMWAEPELAPQLTHYIGWVGERPVAAILVLRTHDTAVYLHGGSARAERQKMAPYLVHWTAIRVAKQQGLTRYDLRGVAPVDARPDHPWSGFSRFKRGFGGVDVAYPGAYDWVRRPFLYGLYRLAQRGRK